MLSAAFINGFGLMAGLIVAIGAQNAFVLRQGIKREHVFLTSSICFLSDILLVVLGVIGLGAIIAQHPEWIEWAKWFGGAFLIAYGLRSFYAAYKPGHLEVKEGPGQVRSMKYIISTAMALTWLNPHVYLDTVVLMGSVGIQYPPEERWHYVMGANLASGAWFYGLGYTARLLVPFFKTDKAWQWLDIVTGLIMWLAAYAILTMDTAG